MFDRLHRLIDNTKKLDQDKIFVEIVSSRGVQAFIISLNTVDQIFLDGEQSDGSDITSTNDTIGVYGDSTINYPYFKGKMNPFRINQIDIDELGFIRSQSITKSVGVGDPYILSQSGNYLASYKVIVDNGGFTITANDSIYSNRGLSSMTKEYGKLEGLNEKSKSELAEAIIPLVVQEVRKTLFS